MIIYDVYYTEKVQIIIDIYIVYWHTEHVAKIHKKHRIKKCCMNLRSNVKNYLHTFQIQEKPTFLVFIRYLKRKTQGSINNITITYLSKLLTISFDDSFILWLHWSEIRNSDEKSRLKPLLKHSDKTSA